MKFKVKNIHFVGIGGVGMSGIAQVLFNLKYTISGSDKINSTVTKNLANLGCKIYIGHSKNNITNSQILVVSSAINKNNPEIIEAKKQNIPIINRAEMLAEIMRFSYGIAIAGTHGKTTTTSIIAHILVQAGLDPSYIIGGILNSSGNNAKLGNSRYLVAEADESDKSFLHLRPMLSVITNIDADHMENYQYNYKNLEQAFLDFIANLPIDGICIICIDDKGIRKIKKRINRVFISYGFSEDADIMATNFLQNGNQISYKVHIKNQNKTIDISSSIIGKHNVQNILGAIAVAVVLNIDIDIIKQSLSNFSGVNRRLQCHGMRKFSNKNILYFDDYGHHPSEINAVITSLKLSYNKRIVVIFQPHRYSRIHNLFDDFITVLTKIDVLILLDIYSASEKAIKNINKQSIANAIYKKNGNNTILASMNSALDKLVNIVNDDDIVLTLGAGDIYKLSDKILATSKACNI